MCCDDHMQLTLFSLSRVPDQIAYINMHTINTPIITYMTHKIYATLNTSNCLISPQTLTTVFKFPSSPSFLLTKNEPLTGWFQGEMPSTSAEVDAIQRSRYFERYSRKWA